MAVGLHKTSEIASSCNRSGDSFVTCGEGWFSTWAHVAILACLSLMFPTICGIALDGVSGDSAKRSIFGLIMAIHEGLPLTPLQALNLLLIY